MFKSFYLDRGWRLWSWGGLATLIISLFFQVRMTVAINTWYGKFYDLLQNAADFKDNPEIKDKQIISWLKKQDNIPFYYDKKNLFTKKSISKRLNTILKFINECYSDYICLPLLVSNITNEELQLSSMVLNAIDEVNTGYKNVWILSNNLTKVNISQVDYSILSNIKKK